MWTTKLKELTLSELIDYVLQQNIRGKYFTSKNGYVVYFTTKGELIILCREEDMSKTYPLEEVFELEIEVYIYTLDTKIPRMLSENVHGIYRDHHYLTINQLPFYESYYDQYKNLYIVNADGTHTLLWHDGTLVNDGEV